MTTDKLVCRFFCHDFLISEEDSVIEFKIVQSGFALRLYKGIHRAQGMEIPNFGFVTNYTNLRSAMIGVFETLRKIELEANLYPSLNPDEKLKEVYLEAIDIFVYSNEHFCTGDFTTFNIYGNRFKFPKHAEDWEYWRSRRDELYRIYGKNIDSYRSIIFW